MQFQDRECIVAVNPKLVIWKYLVQECSRQWYKSPLLPRTEEKYHAYLWKLDAIFSFLLARTVLHLLLFFRTFADF